jgi:hypothetical protein
MLRIATPPNRDHGVSFCIGQIATEIVENCSPSSVTLTKAMLWKQLENSSPEQAHLLDSRLLQWSFNQPDSDEGVQSFIVSTIQPYRIQSTLPNQLWYDRGSPLPLQLFV